MIQIRAIPAFQDNYIWLLSENSSQQCLVVDPGDAVVVEQSLEAWGLELSGILVTHHHWDHTNGIEALTKNRNIPVYGPDNEAITSITHPLRDSDTFTVLNTHFQILKTPGHTLDHIVFFSIPDQGDPFMFCGDTLFSAGCGRLFEGTAEQMQSSFDKLRSLPENTRIYCTHEYTLANLAFAKAVEPENHSIDNYLNRVTQLRQQHRPSLPSTIKLELTINPFMRTDQNSVITAVKEHAPDTTLSSEAEVFGALRQWKDRFQ
ncbi:hydroxyacylglutathione hydrolase [Endozoicomonas numazuensis]|uniref:Hydroxyacylglutathione hydrolase n=1 Tax=Endozoicomonas numazuensis TaxID=1137799 RepID=A0A081N9E6_9GAMM|nr:hydroxyacylglutathione hydrolase [Endozoicomonas numazuensis]KEQ15069.1 hydroxyacylglutathione hydrolase [Endozoicomonas numazuensis]